MRSRPFRPYLSLALLGLAATSLADCHCEGDPLSQHKAGACEPTFKCDKGFEYRNGGCKAARCLHDYDCCPGQKCNVAAGFCADQFVTCTDDSSCTAVPSQTCIDFRGGKFCGYPNKGHSLSQHQTQACVTTGDCDPGRSCFDARCVKEAPCKGGCAPGTICDVDTDSCYTLDACKTTCGDGQMLVVADPDTESGAHCCKVDCKCETLPPVPAGQYGYYASLGITKEDIVVSAYDKTYGDLVLAHFTSDGMAARLEYLDGFPKDGKIVANPNGPRGGRVDPGEDVGLYTSLAVDAQDVVHIAYYDKTNGHLKYANNTGGKWNISIVDADGNVGQFTSLQIGSDGNPRIAYMLIEGTRSPDPTKITALKYATAHSANPSSPTDWTIAFVDTKPKPIPPCNGSCPTGQSCVDMMGMAGPQCVTEDMGCTGMNACSSNQACVVVAGTPKCIGKIPLLPIDDLIAGVGLFASLAVTSTGTAKIAYYDRIDKDLKYAVSRSDGTFQPVVLDGNEPMNPSDVGQHASLALDAMGNVGIAYVDFSNTNLVYMQLANGVKTREVIDNGVTPPDIRMVGPDASLIYDSNGNAAVAYQDPTNIDLLYARRIGSPPMWSTEVLKGGPPMGGMMMMGMMTRGTASGFYASQKRKDMKAFISNVDVTFDPEGNLILRLAVVLKDLL